MRQITQNAVNAMLSNRSFNGRERRNIMIGYDGSNGLVEPILGYEKITFPVSGATYHGGVLS